MYSKISRELCRIFAVIFTASFSWAFILCAAATARNGEYPAFLAVPAIVLIGALFGKYLRRYYLKQSEKVLFSTFAGICVCALIFMFYLSYRLRLTYGVESWDFSRLSRDAYALATGKDEIPYTYYLRYKNNQMMLMVLTVLCKGLLFVNPQVTGLQFDRAARIGNCILIITSVYMCFLIIRRQKGIHFAFLAGILLLLCSPLWLYSPIYYTDTAGLPLMAAPLLFYVHIQKDAYKRNSQKE